MGTYTELHLTVQLKLETPKEVIEFLNDVFNVKSFNDLNKLSLPNHPFFKTHRWMHVFLGDCYYFQFQNHSDFKRNMYLMIHSSFKNYDNEIELFLDWISPYVRYKDEIVGYYRCELTPNEADWIIFRD